VAHAVQRFLDLDEFGSASSPDWQPS